MGLTLLFEDKDISDMTTNQIGSVLEVISKELYTRGTDPKIPECDLLAWAFGEVNDVATTLRQHK